MIHYGLQAGFEDEALSLARRLFAHFDEQIESLTLVPTSEAEFDLVLDEHCIHSYRHSGRAPRLADALLAVRSESPASAVDYS